MKTSWKYSCSARCSLHVWMLKMVPEAPPPWRQRMRGSSCSWSPVSMLEWFHSSKQLLWAAQVSYYQTRLIYKSQPSCQGFIAIVCLIRLSDFNPMTIVVFSCTHFPRVPVGSHSPVCFVCLLYTSHAAYKAMAVPRQIFRYRYFIRKIHTDVLINHFFTVKLFFSVANRLFVFTNEMRFVLNND